MTYLFLLVRVFQVELGVCSVSVVAVDDAFKRGVRPGLFPVRVGVNRDPEHAGRPHGRQRHFYVVFRVVSELVDVACVDRPVSQGHLVHLFEVAGLRRREL